MSPTSPPIDDPSPGPCRPGHASDRLNAALAYDADGRKSPPREPPQLLLYSDDNWRNFCESQKSFIPAGFTYAAQLLGHDLGHSVDAAAVPYANGNGSPDGGEDRAPSRYNLIENPATLETIYGPGPGLAPFLYDPETLLFRVVPKAFLSQLFNVTSLSDPDASPFRIRALYDERNRDTIMLHELAVVWMQFHNRCALQLMGQGLSPAAAYTLARAHCVKLWHGIILGDILRRFVHPDIQTAPLETAWELTETTLLAGLFRAFHAMPRDSYQRDTTDEHNLEALMKGGHETSLAESSGWFFDWEMFLGAKPGGTLTGISASVSAALTASTMGLPSLDLNNAKTAFPNRLGSDEFKCKLATLPENWRDRITAAQLSADFAKEFARAPLKPTADNLSWGPLYYALTIEAQLYGHEGGFGPFGSALLRASVTSTLKRVVLLDLPDYLSKLPKQPDLSVLKQPTTMLELIQETRSP